MIYLFDILRYVYTACVCSAPGLIVIHHTAKWLNGLQPLQMFLLNLKLHPWELSCHNTLQDNNTHLTTHIFSLRGNFLKTRLAALLDSLICKNMVLSFRTQSCCMCRKVQGYFCQSSDGSIKSQATKQSAVSIVLSILLLLTIKQKLPTKPQVWTGKVRMCHHSHLAKHEVNKWISSCVDDKHPLSPNSTKAILSKHFSEPLHVSMVCCFCKSHPSFCHL